jgi:YidC/Oxa1 family membrane protein insertase
MALYRSHGISPFSGFLMLLIQLPIFIALFMLLKEGVSFNSDILYSFVKIPENINTSFLGLIDISKPNYFISVLAGVSQFFQIKLAMPKIKKISSSKERSFKNELQRSMSIQMKYVMPIFVFFIAQRFSSGMALYWTTSNVFAIVHEIIVAKRAKKISKHGQPNTDNKKHNRRYSN